MPAHICASLISLVQQHANRVATSCDGKKSTGQQFHDRVALLSRALSNTLDVAEGDRVAVAGLNSDVLFEALLAIVDAGAVVCPLNTRWSSTEVAAALQLTRPKFIVVDSSAEPLAVAACARLAGAVPRIILLGHSDTSSYQAPGGHIHQPYAHTEQLISDAAAVCRREQQVSESGSYQAVQPSIQTHTTVSAAAANHPQLQLLQSGPDGVALICFTSGTTGRSKGAMLSHSALMHQSLCKLAVVGYTSADVYLHVAPLCHIGGISSALALLTAGGQHVFMPRYSPATALQLIRNHNVTAMIAVPAMMQDITAAAAAAVTQQQHGSANPQQQLLLSLQRVLIGGGTMTAALQSAVAALFPNALLSTAYGMTEGSSSITFITLHEQQRRQAAAAAAAAGSAAAAVGVCVGWPAPGIAVKIDLAAVEQQQQQQQQLLISPSSSSSSSSSSSRITGEVCTRGPHIMCGYWEQPDVTKMTTTNDGWLKTGDLGYLDDQGCLWLMGRAKDMIKSGGENVHASEVESVLLSHPAVAAAAAVGLEHERLGEQVAAAVVLRSGWKWGDGLAVGQQQQQGPAVTVQQQQQGLTLAVQQQQQLSQQGLNQASQQQHQQQVVTAAALQQHCRSLGLSPYKLPRVLVAVEILPLNSSGKVVKGEVKRLIQQQQQQQQGQRKQYDAAAPRSKL